MAGHILMLFGMNTHGGMETLLDMDLDPPHRKDPLLSPEKLKLDT